MKKVFHDQVYGESVFLIINETPTDISRWLQKKFGIEDTLEELSNSEGLYLRLEPKEGKGYHWIRVVLIKNWTNHYRDYAVLSHETLHLVFNIFSDRGVSVYKDDMNEQATYYLEFWMKQFLRQIVIWQEKKLLC